MAKVKFTITFEIKEEQISKFQEENENPFRNVNGPTQQMLAAQVLAIQMLEATLNEGSLKTQDFKIKVNE